MKIVIISDTHGRHEELGFVNASMVDSRYQIARRPCEFDQPPV